MKILKKIVRFQMLPILMAIAITGLVITPALFQPGKAFASDTTPAITPSTSTLHPGEAFTLTGTGFAANEGLKISLDGPNYYLGPLTCDAAGNCSGNETMIRYNILQGQHQLMAYNSANDLRASTTIIIDPILTSVSKGGIGTALQVQGAGFTAGESVQVFWGTLPGTLLGTFTTSAAGDFGGYYSNTFVPLDATPGVYPITAIRTNQKPLHVTTHFRVLAPKITTDEHVADGHTFNFQLEGFKANDGISLSWNASGGQQLLNVWADSTGAASGSVTPTFVPAGKYIVTAQDSNGTLKADTTIHVDVGIVLMPPSTNMGGTITVNGGGFRSGEQVKVYFQTIANGVVLVNVDANGLFTTALTVPTTYDPTINYVVYAEGTKTKGVAQAPFTFDTPGIGISYGSVVYGQPVNLDGSGYSANEQVDLVWNQNLPGKVHLGTVTAGSDGTFTMSFIAPSTPRVGTSNPFTITATGLISQKTSVFGEGGGGITGNGEQPALVVTPSSAPIGSALQISGGGFASNEAVTVSFGSINLPPVTTDASGSFTLPFTVPDSQGRSANVQAVGGSSGISVSSLFTVAPAYSITPATGASGTTITVTGSQATPLGTVTVYWHNTNPSTIDQVGSATVTSTGTFTTTITVPGYAVSGHTYYIYVFDNANHAKSLETPFVVQ